MDFLKSLVPTAVSGEVNLEEGGGSSPSPGFRETGPRLLRVKRLNLLSMGQAVEEGPEGPARGPKLIRSNRNRLKGMV